MFNYLFITNKPDIASYVESCGVSRIFIDLERIGKFERQGKLDTVISQHEFSDISKVKSSLSTAELLVRLNPFHKGSKLEVEKAISDGADIIMLPMIRNLEEVKLFGEFIQKRAKFIPLIETISSAFIINDICKLESVDELHIGLNDLHLELNLSFMFELISNGYVDKMVKDLTKPFGIGGIARVGQGEVNGESVMSQHVRLKSSGVILSRAFHLRATSLDELKSKLDLQHEILLLNSAREEFLVEPVSKIKERKAFFVESVKRVTSL